MKNTVRALLVAAVAVPALALAQVPAAPAAPAVPSTAAVKDATAAQTKSTGAQVTDTVKIEGKKQSKTAVDAGAKKTGSVGAAVAPQAQDAAAAKAGIK